MHTPPRQRRGEPQAGLTLVEILVVLVIMTIVSTMLVGGWISLQRSFAFARADNKSRATARDALDRIASEIRTAQPETTSTPTPFWVSGTTPYVCDAYDCVFYSAYNNPDAALQSGQNGIGTVRLTAIWLDTSGTAAQKTLYWQRDTAAPYGTFTSADRKVVLARNVVNTALSPAVPIFTYIVYNTELDTYPTPPTTLTSANTSGDPSVASLVSVQVELVVDANVAHTPSYTDLRTTVQPRNQVTGD